MQRNASVFRNTDSHEFNTPTAVSQEIASITAHSPPSFPPCQSLSLSGKKIHPKANFLHSFRVTEGRMFFLHKKLILWAKSSCRPNLHKNENPSAKRDILWLSSLTAYIRHYRAYKALSRQEWKAVRVFPFPWWAEYTSTLTWRNSEKGVCWGTVFLRTDLRTKNLVKSVKPHLGHCRLICTCDYRVVFTSSELSWIEYQFLLFHFWY